MTNRVITIKKVGNANNVMYRDVLVGCFEDGDTESLAAIIDRAIDVYIERSTPKTAEIRDACVKLAELSYDVGRKGGSKSSLTTLINIACR